MVPAFYLLFKLNMLSFVSLFFLRLFSPIKSKQCFDCGCTMIRCVIIIMYFVIFIFAAVTVDYQNLESVANVCYVFHCSVYILFCSSSYSYDLVFFLLFGELFVTNEKSAYVDYHDLRLFFHVAFVVLLKGKFMLPPPLACLI